MSDVGKKIIAGLEDAVEKESTSNATTGLGSGKVTTCDPERKLALSAIDAEAQVDDLLGEYLDETRGARKARMGDLAGRLDDLVQQHLRENKDAADRSAEATYDDLLRPTEERVRQTVSLLYEGAKNLRENIPDHPDAITLNRAAGLLETLLAENKALRDNPPIYLNLENGNILNVYNPDTHVALPREPTEAMLMAGEQTRPCYYAMLTAAQEGE